MIISTHGILASSYIPFIPLLDTYSGAVGAYSLRKLRTAYSGHAIRVRRSSDNTSQDIGFSNGNLDTSSLISFVGSNDGYVSIFYDQSGYGYNFEQSNSAYQPKIVTSGSVITKNSKPIILFDGTSDFMNVNASNTYFSFLHKTGQAYFSFVGYNRISHEGVYLANNYGSSGATGYAIYSNTSQQLINLITRGVPGSAVVSNASSSSTITVNSLFLISNELDNGNSTASLRGKLYLNTGSAIANNTLTNTPSTNDANYTMYLGVAGGPAFYGYLDGGVSEIIMYNSNQTTNKTGISTNQLTYYSI